MTAMQIELLVSIIGAGGALLGVALGLFGARMQAKGAHAQADGTRDAAAVTLTVQARDARRPVYAQALTAARAYSARMHELELTGATPDDVSGIAEQLENAIALVELEGPESLHPVLTGLAHCAIGAGNYVILEAETIHATRRIQDATESDDARVYFAAIILQESLNQVTAGVRELDGPWRRFYLHRGALLPELDRTQAYQTWAERHSISVPPHDIVHTVEETLAHHQEAADSAVRHSVVTRDQVERLFRQAITTGTPGEQQLHEALDAFDTALTVFRRQAYRVLHPGEESPQRQGRGRTGTSARA
ncbi:hypothetical protein ACFV5J_26440 [Streptomyces zaomyceticus]|uniref:hypothetical protein n=1 Tax=Streptomyces zaomyceticus TaxID=68286 RepID=UPI00364DA7F9